MDTLQINRDSIGAYEMLLTYLCQCMFAIWGWCKPVADPVRAKTDVLMYALEFGDEHAKILAKLAGGCPDERLFKKLSPILCSGEQLKGVLQITPLCTNIVSSAKDKEILIWDSGKGSRMGYLLRGVKSKGDIEVWKGHKLYEFSASAAKWLVNELKVMGRSYVALAAADQIVFLHDEDKRELRSSLEAACAQDADIVFFAGPPALDISRLWPLLSQSNRPQRDSQIALARDRAILKYYGGTYVFQCVLLKRSTIDLLTKVLEIIQEAAIAGYEMDFGVFDVAVLPKFVRPCWLKKERYPQAHELYSALCDFALKAANAFALSVPIEVFNVNTPVVLECLQKRMDQHL
jgi:hypothetical protein